MTEQEYASIPGIRSSDLMRARKSALHYRTPPTQTDTAAWQMGRLVHALVLEPHEVPARYAVWTGKARRGKDYDAWAESHADMEIVTEAVYGRCQAIAAAVSEAMTQRLGPTLQAEQLLTWKECGLPCKARYDARGAVWLADIKTYGTSDPRAIMRMVASKGAHIQAAHYVAGARANGLVVDHYYLVSVETSAPYDVAILDLVAGGAVDAGQRERADLLRVIAAAEQSGVYPGMCPEVEPGILPAWAETSDLEMEEVSFE